MASSFLELLKIHALNLRSSFCVCCWCYFSRTVEASWLNLTNNKKLTLFKKLTVLCGWHVIYSEEDKKQITKPFMKLIITSGLQELTVEVLIGICKT